jgi:hypothetical protein
MALSQVSAWVLANTGFLSYGVKLTSSLGKTSGSLRISTGFCRCLQLVNISKQNGTITDIGFHLPFFRPTMPSPVFVFLDHRQGHYSGYG